jgi:hypothetical protein
MAWQERPYQKSNTNEIWKLYLKLLIIDEIILKIFASYQQLETLIHLMLWPWTFPRNLNLNYMYLKYIACQKPSYDFFFFFLWPSGFKRKIRDFPLYISIQKNFLPILTTCCNHMGYDLNKFESAGNQEAFIGSWEMTLHSLLFQKCITLHL